jgi:hypothetical protein
MRFSTLKLSLITATSSLMQFSHANIPADCDFEATYRGAMKQLRLRLPATNGTADVRRIELRW